MIKKWFYFIVIIFLTAFSQGIQTKANEYDLKAAFIYNFTKFIEWDSFKGENEFIIGIIGPSPIFGPLAEISKAETIKNKKVSIHQFNTLDEIGFCQILFISRNSTISLDEILKKEKSKNTLIISEQEGYCDKGTAINFINSHNKLKFEANLKVINSIGIKVSSQLLKLAVIKN